MRPAWLGLILAPLAEAGVLYWPSAAATPVQLPLSRTDDLSSNGEWVIGWSGGTPVSLNLTTLQITIIPALPFGMYINNSGAAALDRSAGVSYYWNGSSLTPIGPGPVAGINNAGQVLGASSVWSPGSGSTPLGGPNTFTGAINNAGIAACGLAPPLDFQTLGYCDLGTGSFAPLVGGLPFLVINGMNDSGWIIGEWQTGWVYIPGVGLENLDFFPLGINSRGTIVGYRDKYGPTGFLGTEPIIWTRASGSEVLQMGGFSTYGRLSRISEDGEILGEFTPVPVPEPATFIPPVIAVVALFLRRR